jgi:hypothetical protein
MPQPVPKVTRADMERIVRRDFPVEQLPEVMAILHQFGMAEWEKKWDVNRVQLAMLKLAGENIDKLREALTTAKSDPRDVISPAEYPSYGLDKFKLPEEEQEKIFSTDWKHYETWLNAK